MPNRDFSAHRNKPRGKHLMPSKLRRPVPRVRENIRKVTPGRHSTVLNSHHAGEPNGRSVDDALLSTEVTLNGSHPAAGPPSRTEQQITRPEQHITRAEPHVNGNGASVNGTISIPAITAVQTPVRGRDHHSTEDTIHHMWQSSETHLTEPPLLPSSAHSLRQITAHRSRSGLWTTLGVVGLAAALTVVLLMVLGGPAGNIDLMKATVLDAAGSAAASVQDSGATLQSLRAGSPFTPELVSSISALGDSSRHLVESAAALPTDEQSLAEIRMAATALAGRVSRLGETFGAAFSYRGQLASHLTFPALNGPLEVSNLSENTTVLTDWQFRLEQAASTQPGQPRLLQNQQALAATLPYIAVHRQAYTDAVGNGQSEQAQAALAQINSLISAISQDFDRAYREIGEIAEAEIRSLTADLQSLSEGT